MRRSVAVLAAVALGAAAAILPAAAAQAVPCVVTTTTWNTGGSILANVTAANSGLCDGDTITFAPALDNQTIDLGDQILITRGVTITADPARNIGFSHSADFDMFRINLATAGNVTFHGLGFNGDGDIGQFGSAIVAVNDNAVILNLAIENDNFTRFHSTSAGGALALNEVSGTLTISDTDVSLSESDFSGGALYVGDSGPMTVTNSRLLQNVATEGGGAYLLSPASLMMTGTTFAENEAEVWGGGLFISEIDAGTSTVDLGVFDRNAVGIDGEIVSTGSGAAMYVAVVNTLSQLNLTRTTFSNNDTWVQGEGTTLGTVAFDDLRGVVRFNSSTWFGNAFLDDGDRGYASGLSIGVCGIDEIGYLGIEQSTFSEGYQYPADAQGWAIDVCSNGGTAEVGYSTFVTDGVLRFGYSGNATVHSSILDGGTAPSAVVVDDGIVHATWSLVSSSAGVTSIANDGGVTFNTTGPGIVGPLAFNGGPTQTRLPLATGPAYNSGEVGDVGPAANDQRGAGFPRFLLGRIDIGSTEIPLLPATGSSINWMLPLGALLLVLAGLAYMATRRFA